MSVSTTVPESAEAFSERMVALWLRMETARKQVEAITHRVGKAVAYAVDAFRLSVQDGQLYSDDKLDILEDAINAVLQTAIPQALDETKTLLQVARDARTLADAVDDRNTSKERVAHELAARAESWVQRLRDFILGHTSFGKGLRGDDATLQQLTELWKGAGATCPDLPGRQGRVANRG